MFFFFFVLYYNAMQGALNIDIYSWYCQLCIWRLEYWEYYLSFLELVMDLGSPHRDRCDAFENRLTYILQILACFEKSKCLAFAFKYDFAIHCISHWRISLICGSDLTWFDFSFFLNLKIFFEITQMIHWCLNNLFGYLSTCTELRLL